MQALHAAGQISVAEYERQKQQYTALQLQSLQEYVRQHDVSVQRTQHYKKQIRFVSKLRLHWPTWRASLGEPLFWMKTAFGASGRMWMIRSFLYLLMVLYVVVVGVYVVGDYFGLARVLGPYSFFAPIVLYTVFAMMYATQKACWIPTKDTTTKLREMRFSTTENGRTVTKGAMEVVDSIIASAAREGLSMHWITLTSLTISFWHTVLPLAYSTLRESGGSCLHVPFSRLGFLLCMTATVCSFFFCFLFYFIFLMELGISLNEFYRRYMIMSRFSSLSKKGPHGRPGIPTLELTTAENIVCWSRIREYLKEHKRSTLLEFEIVLATLMMGILVLCPGMVYRTIYKQHYHLFDIVAIFNIIIIGGYLLIVALIGARMDTTQKSHIRFLYKQQWKMQQQTVHYKGATQVPDMTGEDEIYDIDPGSPISDDREQSPSLKSRLSPFSSPITSPKSTDELRMYQICESLFSKLIRVLETTDRPPQILFIPLNYSFLLKMFSYLMIGVVSGIKSLLKGQS